MMGKTYFIYYFARMARKFPIRESEDDAATKGANITKRINFKNIIKGVYLYMKMNEKSLMGGKV